MNIQYITLNPGSILLQKDYSWFKKFWYKLRGKELPYNYFTLFGTESALINVWGKNTTSIVVEPKKGYSKKELKNLINIITNCNKDKDEWLSSFDATTKDLFITINAVRPGTFSDEETKLNSLLSSKYYNTRVLADECNWNEYIF